MLTGSPDTRAVQVVRSCAWPLDWMNAVHQQPLLAVVHE
jgi:hypothetical protein